MKGFFYTSEKITGEPGSGVYMIIERGFNVEFFLLPGSIVYTNLSEPAFKIYLLFSAMADNTNTCYPGKKTVQNILGFSSKTSIYNGISELKKCGYLEVCERRLPDGSQKTNIYKIMDVEKCKSRIYTDSSISSVSLNESFCEKQEKEFYNYNNALKDDLVIVEKGYSTGYSIIPNGIPFLRISFSALRIYVLLSVLFDAKKNIPGWFAPSYKNMQQMLNIKSKSTVIKGIKELVSANLLQVETNISFHRGNENNKYYLLCPEENNLKKLFEIAKKK